MNARSAEAIPTRQVRARLLLSVVTALLAGFLLALGQLVGTAGLGGFFFAWVAHFGLMAWTVLVEDAFPPSVDGAGFRIGPGEVRLHRALGLPQLLGILRRGGWDSLFAAHGFDGTRAGLRELDLHTRRSEASHAAALLMTLVLMLAVAVTASASGVVWLAVLALPLHVLPVLGNRYTRSRIQALEELLGRD